MTVMTTTIQINLAGEVDMIDLTEQTAKIVAQSKILDGIVTVFISGSTAAVTAIEYESGLIHAFPEMHSFCK